MCSSDLIARILCLVLLLMSAGYAVAHNVSDSNASYVQALEGIAIVPFIYLGAKHMVTGFDHLLFVLGVIFFLYRPRDVILYVTLFTVGHSLTLLTGVMWRIEVNDHLIDAIIGFSVVYKAFENLGGFQQLFNIEPDSRIAVLIFGLFHGFGLATKLQALNLSEEGLLANLLSFNLGVELGQLMVLGLFLLLLSHWRQRASFRQHAFLTNSALMTCGFIFIGIQLTAWSLEIA